MFAIFTKEDNFCDFRFAFRHTKHIKHVKEMRLLYKEIIFSPWKYFFPFLSRHVLRRSKDNFDRVPSLKCIPSLNVKIFLNIYMYNGGPDQHYENMPIQIYWKFYHQKMKFSDKNSDIFHISAQNIDCWHSLEPPRRGGSNEYPQSMFLSRNKKNVYPCKPKFYYIKVGFKGVKNI